MSRGAIATALALAILGACSPGATGQSSVSPSVATVGSPNPLGAAGCQPASPPGAFAAEIYGTATGGTVWAWFMSAYPPQAGIEDKTVWRLDGPHVFGVPTFTRPRPTAPLGR